MDINNTLPWEDRIKLALRALYESYGFRQYRMGRFEPYNMYYEHKDFLRSETVITFTDAAGRLMALKPDVTMSIVKDTKPEDVSRKLYYIENVFRIAPGSREYSEISQIGIESIGAEDVYGEAETLLLALRTLEAITPNHVLNISHMGFVGAVLDVLPEGYRASAIDALTHKNLHELMEIAQNAGVSFGNAELLRRTALTSGEVAASAAALRELPLTPEMSAALDEILDVYSVINGRGERVRLDFTLVNNLDYYNGIVFSGYIENLPRAVLAGGRYDKLMRRFGKPQSALGFALYLGELTRAFTKAEDYDADCLLIYGGADADAVLIAADELRARGFTVRAERQLPPELRARHTFILDENELREVSRDA